MVKYTQFALTASYTTPPVTIADNGTLWDFGYWGCTGASGSGSTAKAVLTVVPAGPSPSITGIIINPGLSNIKAGAAQTFAAAVAAVGGASTVVSWTASCGSIDGGGNFTASAQPATCTVTATSQFDSTKSAKATVFVHSAVINTKVVLSYDDGTAFVGSVVIQSVVLNPDGTTTTTTTVADATFDPTGTAIATVMLDAGSSYQVGVMDASGKVVLGLYPIITAFFDLSSLSQFEYSGMVRRADKSIVKFTLSVN